MVLFSRETSRCARHGMTNKMKCQQQYNSSHDEYPATPGISFVGRCSETRRKQRAQAQPSNEASQMRGVGNAGHHGTKEQVVSRERHQAFQSDLNRIGRNRQASQIESGNQRSRDSENRT